MQKRMLYVTQVAIDDIRKAEQYLRWLTELEEQESTAEYMPFEEWLQNRNERWVRERDSKGWT